MASIEVAVAVIMNAQLEVLLSWRQSHQHQGSLWEFPGGKREADETMFEALKRELDEELGLAVTQAEPFIRIDHDYGDKLVSLDVWLVSEYSGDPVGREGQTIQWQALNTLSVEQFPVANVPIIEALKHVYY